MLTDQQINDLAQSVVTIDDNKNEFSVLINGIPFAIPVLSPRGNAESFVYMLAAFARMVQSVTSSENAAPFSTIVRTSILDDGGAVLPITFQDGVLAAQVAILLQDTYQRGVEHGRRKRTGSK